MKNLKLFGLFAAGLIVGAISAYWFALQAFGRLVEPVDRVMAQFISAEANFLAGLRLNDTQRVIQAMEHDMDVYLASIGSIDKDPRFQLGSEYLKSRNRWLTAAKLYHEVYPPTGEYAGPREAEESANRVKAVLANIPGRQPGSACSNWVCQLNDLRLNSKTNALAK